MVLGQQLRHAPPASPGDDLCGTGRLRVNAAGVWLCVFDLARACTCLPELLTSKSVRVICLKKVLTCLLLPAEVWRDRRSHVDVRAPIRRPCLLCVCNLVMLHPHIVAPTAFHTMIWNTAKAFQSFVFPSPCSVCQQQHNVYVIFAQYSPSHRLLDPRLWKDGYVFVFRFCANHRVVAYF